MAAPNDDGVPAAAEATNGALHRHTTVAIVSAAAAAAAAAAWGHPRAAAAAANSSSCHPLSPLATHTTTLRASGIASEHEAALADTRLVMATTGVTALQQQRRRHLQQQAHDQAAAEPPPHQELEVEVEEVEEVEVVVEVEVEVVEVHATSTTMATMTDGMQDQERCAVLLTGNHVGPHLCKAPRVRLQVVLP